MRLPACVALGISDWHSDSEVPARLPIKQYASVALGRSCFMSGMM